MTLEVAASPDEVFGYLTDQQRYVRWMGAAAVLDPRPGGRYEVSMSDGFRAAGRFEAVDRPHRVVFTWDFADDAAAAYTVDRGSGPPAAAALSAGSSRVTVTLAPAGPGTRLVLRHDRLPTPELVAAHQVDWETYLPRLAAVAAGADPGPDPHGGS